MACFDRLVTSFLVIDILYLIFIRCISAEDSCKKHLKTIEQLNKNVDELNSAMIELGQENQNLQVEQNIRNNRKWEKDNDVVQCNACAKKFSVSVRKVRCNYEFAVTIATAMCRDNHFSFYSASLSKLWVNKTISWNDIC